MRTWRWALCWVALCWAPLVQGAAPNILVVLVDDLGYSDLGSYGSEIRTPNIDALASRGVMFSNYHTAPSCAPTRGMLLTGVDSHRNGVPNINEAIPPEQLVNPDYRGVLSDDVVTVATLLADAGYHTYMSGKWHLGQGPGELPIHRGFERTVTMADTGADNWEQKPYLPIYEQANWYENGERLQLPDDFYSSRYLVDRMIEFIDADLDDGRPFFAYLPFQAVHIPVQAPREFTERYLGTYDDGWDALRQQRLQRAVQLGLVPQDTEMVRMATTADWDSFSAEERRYLSKRMAVYAGMVEAMDEHLGRLLAFLRARGVADDTLIVITSDNGSEASGPDAAPRDWFLSLQGYRADYETLGERGSFNLIGPGFASAAAAPLAYYKFFAGEGGMRVPLIVAAPPGQLQPRISDAFAWVTDLAPTLLEFAGVALPGAQYRGRDVKSMDGRSLGPLLRGETDEVYGADAPVGAEMGGNAALFLGDHKIVRNFAPPGDGQWRLYDLRNDPGETRDLSTEQPRLFERMQVLYAEYEAANGVQPMPPGYDQNRVVFIKGLRQRFGPTLLWLLLWGAYLVPFAIWWRRSRRLPAAA